MSYDDVEVEDMEWNEELDAFTYPCPCGDLFQITKEDLRRGEENAHCPSCSLYIRVIYNQEDFQEKTRKNQKKTEKIATENGTTVVVMKDVQKVATEHKATVVLAA